MDLGQDKKSFKLAHPFGSWVLHMHLSCSHSTPLSSFLSKKYIVFTFVSTDVAVAVHHYGQMCIC